MRQLAEVVQDIVVQEKSSLKSEHLQIATDLLALWMNSTRDDFCKAVVLPAIQKIEPRAERKQAKSALKRIKRRLAETMDQLARLQLHHRKSAEVMHTETLAVYALIEKIGRGIVYFGSARTKPGERYYEDTRELAREVAMLLKTPTWTGAGPGQMEAPLIGASEAGEKIGGIKIALNGEQSHFEQDVSSILKSDDVAICKFFGPRKIGLVDAAMRQSESDKTAIIVTPGGYGTLDEFFEFVVLKQLKKLGTKYPVPIIMMNYDGFYDGLMQFLVERCVKQRVINDYELELFHVAATNEEALDILAETYKIPEEQRTYRERSSNTRAPVDAA